MSEVSVQAASQFDVVFDETNEYWSARAVHNTMFLSVVQNQANDLLRLQGHLTINEIYGLLGLGSKKSMAGALHGWTKDSFVSFAPLDADASSPVELSFNINTTNAFEESELSPDFGAVIASQEDAK